MDAALSSITLEPGEIERRPAALACLTGINLDDLVSSFGWRDHPLLAGLVRRLLRSPAQTFARQILDFDRAVGASGLVRAARQILPSYVTDVRVVGGERIPSGPFLALANHPGLSDALSLFSALNRPDLLVVALQRPFLGALPHVSRQLACLSDEPAAHAPVLRRVASHLRSGGAALSFPAGRIEPDPDLGDAADSLNQWSRSAGSLVRLAPEAAILPVLVRGVVWPRAARGWMAASKPRSGEKAAALQLLAHVVLKLTPVRVTVQIGRPIHVGTPAAANGQAGAQAAQEAHRAVLAEMTELIRNPPRAMD